MGSSLEQSIASAVMSAVATAIAAIQVKYKGEMFSLREMIEKSLLLRTSFFATPLPNPNVAFKAYPITNSLLKNITEK